MAGGSKAWVLTEEKLEYIEKMSKMGMTEASIARNIGVHPSTFSEKKQIHPEIEEAIKRGNAVGEEVAISALWQMMLDPKSKGHVTGTIFYLKCKHNWNDGSRQTTEITAPSGLKFEVIPTGKNDGKDKEE